MQSLGHGLLPWRPGKRGYAKSPTFHAHTQVHGNIRPRPTSAVQSRRQRGPVPLEDHTKLWVPRRQLGTGGTRYQRASSRRRRPCVHGPIKTLHPEARARTGFLGDAYLLICAHAVQAHLSLRSHRNRTSQQRNSQARRLCSDSRSWTRTYGQCRAKRRARCVFAVPGEIVWAGITLRQLRKKVSDGKSLDEVVMYLR